MDQVPHQFEHQGVHVTRMKKPIVSRNQRQAQKEQHRADERIHDAQQERSRKQRLPRLSQADMPVHDIGREEHRQGRDKPTNKKSFHMPRSIRARFAGKTKRVPAPAAPATEIYLLCAESNCVSSSPAAAVVFPRAGAQENHNITCKKSKCEKKLKHQNRPPPPRPKSSRQPPKNRLQKNPSPRPRQRQRKKPQGPNPPTPMMMSRCARISSLKTPARPVCPATLPHDWIEAERQLKAESKKKKAAKSVQRSPGNRRYSIFEAAESLLQQVRNLRRFNPAFRC